MEQFGNNFVDGRRGQHKVRVNTILIHPLLAEWPMTTIKPPDLQIKQVQSNKGSYFGVEMYGSAEKYTLHHETSVFVAH